MVVRLEQPLNILAKEVTFDVLNPLKSTVDRLEQCQNRYLMLVTCDVLRYDDMPEMEVRLVIPSNHS